MANIIKVDRYGTYTGDYMFFVHHENGDIEQYGSGNLPKTVKLWMAQADFHFMKNKRGEYFHRFS